MADSAHPLVLRAREAFARSEIKTAELAVEERLKMAGRDVNALEVRYLIQKHRGQLGEAARTLNTVIGINARADWAHNALIQLLMAHGKVNDAEQVARAALRVNPNNAQANSIFGSLISDAGNLRAGEWHLRRAVELSEAQAPLLTNLADNLRKQGRLEEAEGYFSRAHDLAPTDVKTLASWTTLCEAKGDLARAGELIDCAAAASPEEVSLLRSSHLARMGRHEEALATLEAAKSLGGEGQLARGRLHERLGRYEEAWQDFVAGKRKLASEAGGLQYKADAVETLFERFKQFFTRENIEKMPRAKLRTDVPQPIFIMGPPRSGATLVERIVCSHTGVAAGGEITFLAELPKVATEILLAQQPFPESLAQSWTADRRFIATVLRDYYLAHAESYGLLDGDKAFFTDKMPLNEVYLPLLKMAFPQAKILQVVRHPLDLCVSMMSNNVTHGLHCGYRIEDTAHHLAAVFDLSEHYRRELNPGAYVLRYESLIADPAGETRKLLDYLALPFEEACLRFGEQRRQIPIPGGVPFTDGIDGRSVNRHRHYAQQLKPHVSRVRSIMAAYGYE
jgi:tetratricopeptide (TPR) repeat protein